MGYKPFCYVYIQNAFYCYHRTLGFKSIERQLVLTKRLLRRAENCLNLIFDIVYRSGNKNVVPDFLSRIYLVELTSPDEDGKDQEIAKIKNKIFVPFADRSQLLEQAHETHYGHLRTAKLQNFMSSRYFWLVYLET